MKKVVLVLTLVLSALTFTSCEKEEITQNDSKVSLSEVMDKTPEKNDIIVKITGGSSDTLIASGSWSNVLVARDGGTMPLGMVMVLTDGLPGHWGWWEEYFTQRPADKTDHERPTPSVNLIIVELSINGSPYYFPINTTNPDSEILENMNHFLYFYGGKHV